MRARTTTFLLVPLLLSLAAPRLLVSQERGAAALSESVRGLGSTVRVLMIGAHPDDEDTQLITWLARGQRMETAYLSLTRGDGGQNLIGNELGPALGVIRTEELLAARRVDGGRQYFTRAYDFGFSKSADETYAHWPKHVILRDVVSIVRAFRPHVIVAVFSGTPRDGHGHHQVAGMLAREAFDAAGDTTRFPVRMTGRLGPWTPLKFYRSARFDTASATLRVNVGAYNPVLGRSYAEIAGESRSQHRSQAFGSLQPKGVRWTQVRLEASRVSDAATARDERSMFDGIDTTWARFAGADMPAATRAAVEGMPASLAAIRAAERVREPETMVPALAAHVLRLRAARDSLVGHAADRTLDRPCPSMFVPLCGGALGDLAVTLGTALERAERALVAAAGVAVEASAARGLVAAGDSVAVVVEVFNRGTVPVEVDRVAVVPQVAVPGLGASRRLQRMLPPDSASRDTLQLRPGGADHAWWLARPYSGALFNYGDGEPDTERGATFGVANMLMGEDRVRGAYAMVDLRVAGAPVRVDAIPVVHRYADPATGEVRRPVAAVPPITVLLPGGVEYVRANRPVARVVRVHVQSTASRARDVTVGLTLPPGLRADSASRRVTLPAFGQATVQFTVRGTMAPGMATMYAEALSEGERFNTGFVPIEYPHIAPRQFYRPAGTWLSAVDVRLPAGIKVAYVPGVGDNVAPMLDQLDIPVTTLDTASLATADLTGYTAIVVGPRAYEANDALVAANPRILEFARRGGTVVVQYGQYEMQRPGIMPYPIVLGRPADRVTEEQAAVRIVAPASPIVRFPNRIDSTDFVGWVQERSIYMPRSFDAAYTPVFELADPGEPPNRGAVLVARVGRGTYVYTTFSFFRQLPMGVPGAARLFVNLLGAGSRAGTP